MPEEDYDLIADVANSGGPRREPREVLLAALSQARALTTIVNSSLKVSAAPSADRKNSGNLKVHKIENFFDSDFGICVISLLVMHK